MHLIQYQNLSKGSSLERYMKSEDDFHQMVVPTQNVPQKWLLPVCIWYSFYHTQAYLEDAMGLVLDHCNRSRID